MDQDQQTCFELTPFHELQERGARPMNFEAY